jgi:hypothetical protein
VPTAPPERLATDPLLMVDLPTADREVLEQYIKSVQFQNPTAVTLTMKKRAGSRAADSIIASENFRHFRNRLNHVVLGSRAKRHGARLTMVVVLEVSADHRLHFHCIIERPSHCPFPQFAALIREQWWKTDFGYHQVDVQDQSDTGWTDYILKQRQKRSLFDSIDWQNCHLIAE